MCGQGRMGCRVSRSCSFCSISNKETLHKICNVDGKLTVDMSHKVTIERWELRVNKSLADICRFICNACLLQMIKNDNMNISYNGAMSRRMSPACEACRTSPDLSILEQRIDLFPKLLLAGNLASGKFYRVFSLFKEYSSIYNYWFCHHCLDLGKLGEPCDLSCFSCSAPVNVTSLVVSASICDEKDNVVGHVTNSDGESKFNLPRGMWHAKHTTLCHACANKYRFAGLLKFDDLDLIYNAPIKKTVSHKL